jgi:dienelactone hydrolase
MLRLLLLLPLLLGACSTGWPGQVTNTVAVPLTVKERLGERTLTLAAFEYRPEGRGPFPAIVLSHGSTGSAQRRQTYDARFTVASAVFVTWGFVVLSPLRRGYAESGGSYAEDYGSCGHPSFVEAGLETAKDIAAAVAYLRRHPFVDRQRIVLVGQSGGGWGSLAAASRGDLPIRGVVNFAGGRGGKHNDIPNNNCSPDDLVAAAGRLGTTARAPSLWLYTENDLFFAPGLSRRMHRAYTASGGKATYHLLPAIGKDGHNLIRLDHGVALWQDRVEAFFRDIGALAAR